MTGNTADDPAVIIGAEYDQLDKAREALWAAGKAVEAAQVDGFPDLDSAHRVVADCRRAIVSRLAETPATTPKGVAVKVRRLLEGFEHGPTGHEEDIARSALVNLEHMAD